MFWIFHVENSRRCQSCFESRSKEFFNTLLNKDMGEGLENGSATLDTRSILVGIPISTISITEIISQPPSSHLTKRGRISKSSASNVFFRYKLYNNSTIFQSNFARTPSHPRRNIFDFLLFRNKCFMKRKRTPSRF